ncbi:MAG: DUF3800 domain-containing protein [Henriciella sp.]|uniref:DUF3800 domain-containing protein n=1 Tax=Henriciella sp. TaxID=1968823 RepID=UPI0032ED26B1
MTAQVRAFGGGPLHGSKWVRIAFLDETGISNIEHEPFAIVAGVIVHGDTDYLPLETRLAELVDEFFPKTHVEKRFIHTGQIYGGYGPFHKSQGWDEARRFGLIDELAKIPSELGLPIVWGAFERKKFAPHPKAITDKESVYSHVQAAVNCTLQVERAMREFCPSDEICSLVMENRDEARKLLKDAHRFLQNPPAGFVQGNNRFWMPLTRIRHTPHFEDKEDAGLLQMADFCCLVIKRRFMRDDRIAPYYEALRKSISFFHFDADHPIGMRDSDAILSQVTKQS